MVDRVEILHHAEDLIATARKEFEHIKGNRAFVLKRVGDGYYWGLVQKQWEWFLLAWRQGAAEQKNLTNQERKAKKQCLTCSRPMDVPGDPLSMNCGGDCAGCVRQAEGGSSDPRPRRKKPWEGQVCEVCDDPQACWEGRDVCTLSCQRRDPSTGKYALDTAWLDPCVGMVMVDMPYYLQDAIADEPESLNALETEACRSYVLGSVDPRLCKKKYW
jgi:hypothetical protein